MANASLTMLPSARSSEASEKTSFYPTLCAAASGNKDSIFSDRVANVAHDIHRVILADVLPHAFLDSQVDLFTLELHLLGLFVHRR